MHQPQGPTDGDGTDHQDEVELPAPVPEEWLESFGNLASARRLRTLEQDKNRLVAVMFSGYQGRDWDDLVNSLCEYAVTVIASWAYRGQLSYKVKSRGLGSLPATLRFRDRQEARSMANETVAAALVAFRDTVLIPGHWDPTRGASLRTFFIGQCLLRVRNVYRRGLKSADIVLTKTGVIDEGAKPIFHPRLDDPADVAVTRDELQRVVIHLDDPRSRRIVVLRAVGTPDREIAISVGLNEEAVRKMLYRLRQRVRAA